MQPDVVFIGAENLSRVEDPFVRGAPDLVVEVSSPATRKLDTVGKRAIYERFGVPEYWSVDLEAERVETHRLINGRYPAPDVLLAEEILTSPIVPGFSIRVSDLLSAR